MFLGGNQQVDKVKGKRTSGFTARKEGEFSLGWDVSNQMNDFQLKKQRKEQNMAIKVGGQKGQELVIEQQISSLTFQEKCRLLIQENPKITSNELQERMALWQMSNQQRQGKPAQQAPKGNTTFKPKLNQSNKNVIYGGNQQQPPQRGGSKGSVRNQATFSLGDYNYFKDQSNNRLK